jgi:hypothetical protein
LQRGDGGIRLRQRYLLLSSLEPARPTRYRCIVKTERQAGGVFTGLAALSLVEFTVKLLRSYGESGRVFDKKGSFLLHSIFTVRSSKLLEMHPLCHGKVAIVNRMLRRHHGSNSAFFPRVGHKNTARYSLEVDCEIPNNSILPRIAS